MGPRLTPRVAAAVYRFRIRRGRGLPTSSMADPRKLPIAEGNIVELKIESVFPTTVCFVRVDLVTFAIRWTIEHFVGLHTVQQVQIDNTQSSSSHRSMRNSSGTSRGSRHSSVRHQTNFPPISARVGTRLPQIIHSHATNQPDASDNPKVIVLVKFSDRGGIMRFLRLYMARQEATFWVDGLQLLLKTIPAPATPAHWRWALCCMAATGREGATGILRRSKLRSLMICANSSLVISVNDLESAVQAVDDHKKHADLPQWLRSALAYETQQRGLLSALQISELLLALCTSSAKIDELFERFSVCGTMSPARWLEFVRAEQLPVSGHREPRSSCLTSAGIDLGDDEEELTRWKRRWQRSTSDELDDRLEMNRLKFAMHLLDRKDNNVLDHTQSPSARDDLNAPLAQCIWTVTRTTVFARGPQCPRLAFPWWQTGLLLHTTRISLATSSPA